MTTWRAAGERPRPTTDVVFVARRPKVLNMSGVRQRLQDGLQLRIQKGVWAGRETSGAQLERVAVLGGFPAAGNDFERHEFFIFYYYFLLA